MTQKQKRDAYQRLNDMILKGLKEEGLKWFAPFKRGNSSGLMGIEYPVNHATGKQYRGINIFTLSAEARMMAYKYNRWMTFKQCGEAGGKINKSEQSTEVFFWKPYIFDRKTNQAIDMKKVKDIDMTEEIVTSTGKVMKRYFKTFFLKFFLVWNIEQTTLFDEYHESQPVEEVPEEEQPTVEEVRDDIEKRYNEYLGDNKIKLTHEAGRAYYSPMLEKINVPEKSEFVDVDSYYKTLFHEIAHSTGHKNRLNRSSLVNNDGYGNETYSKEELVAEISSVYLTELYNLDPQDGFRNSQAYINGWYSHIASADQKEAVTAMTQAAKVVEYYLEQA